MTRRSLLASLMALSLLCGGLGVAEATVHVNEGTGVTSEVYTTGETYSRELVDEKLNSKANANDVATNTANIVNLENNKLSKADASITYATKADVNTELTKKADKADVYSKTDAENTFATKTELTAKADATALANYATTTDVDTKLAGKADKTGLENATNRITTNEGNIAALKTKTTNLSDDGKALNGMTTVETDALKVTGEISNGAGVTTTLEKIDASMKQTATNTGDITNLKTKTDGQQTAINGLNEKTTKITYDAALGTNVDGVTFNAGKVTGVTSINGIDIGDAQVDMKGKNLTGVGTINGTVIGTNTDGEYIRQDSSIWGNMKNVDTQVGKNAVAIGKNTTAITNLDTKVGGIDDRTGGITRNPEKTQTTIEGAVKVDNQGNVKDVKGLSAETITTGALTVTGASDLKDNVILGTNAANTVTVNGTANFNAAVNMDKGLNVTNGESNLGNTTVTGDLKVTGTITTDKMVFGDPTTNNYTEIDHGKVTSTNLEVRAGQAISSSSTFDVEKNEVGFGNGITDEQSSHKQTSDVITDTVKNNNTGDQSFHKQTSDVIMDNVKDGKNSNNRTQTKTETKDIITDENRNSSTTSQTASQNKTYLKDKDGKNTNSTIDTAKEYDKTIKGENGKTSTKQDELNITNTAQNGTITNDAQNIVNNASGNITNKANTMDTNVTGQATESYGKLDTTVNGAENHTVNGQQTNTVGDGQINNITGGQKNNILTGDQETTVSNGSIINKAEHGNISNTAKNVTNEGTESVTNTVGGNEVKVSTDGVDITAKAGKTIKESVGADTSRTMTDGNIIDKAGDMTVTTDKTTGTTFRNGTLNDTTVINGGTIGTKKVNANETNTKKLTAGAAADANGGRLTVDANDGVKGSYKYGDYTSRSYILANTLQSGVDNGKDITDNGFVGSRTDHYMDSDKAKLNETVKDADGSNVTKKTSTKTYTEIKDTNGNTLSVNQKADGNNYKLEDQDGNTNHVTNSATQSKQTLKDKDGNTLTTNQTATKNNFDLKSADGSKENHTTNTVDESRVAIKGENGKAELSTTDEGTTFKHSAAKEAFTEGGATNTTIKGNTITTGKVTMDYAKVMKDLGVNGNAKIDGKTTTGSLEVTGTSTLKGDVTMGSNATVNGNFNVEGNTNLKNTKVDGTLNVTQKATFDDSVSIAKDLSVGGDVTASSYKVGDKTYISATGINANDQKITNVADGSISEGSKDAVNGGQLYNVKNDLEGKVNKVGANAAAMANLHPMEFDPDSKWNIAAAIGNYGSETAAALGAFYRPNDDVMVNLSTAFGTGENMVGGGVSVRLGKGGNKLSREESNALKDQVNDLTARMDALLSVLNPNMSKDFPDVPENHWAYEAVSRLAGNDIVQGYPDGEFHGERTMTRYEMAEIIYNALSRGAEAEKELVEEFKPELQAMAASEKATAERAEG